jgi:hypothetical protein
MKPLNQDVDGRMIFWTKVSKGHSGLLADNWIEIVKFNQKLVEIIPSMIFHAVASPVVRPKVFANPCCRRRFQAEPSCDLKPKRQV